MSDEPNNIVKLLTALLSPTTDLESMGQQLLTMRFIDTAEGEQLNVLGRIVGQPRNGMIDDDYRRMVRARISVNRSKGTIAGALTVGKLVVGNDLATHVIDNQGAAALVYRVEDEPLPDNIAALTIGMLRDTVSGGVRIILEWSPEAVVNWLKFDVGQLDDELMIGAVD